MSALYLEFFYEMAKKLTFKKIIGKIHLWLGFVSGLVVIILGITGAIYVFEKELKLFFYQDRLFISEFSDEKSPVSKALKAVQKASENRRIVKIHLHKMGYRTHVFSIYEPEPEVKGIWYWNEYGYYKKFYINPFTAEIVKIEDSEFEFFEIIFAMHWSLLLVSEIGQPIVGIAVIIYVISLVTGLILWFPKNRKVAKQRFWFRWKSTTRWKRKNYDIHNIIGFYVMIFALIIGLTGLVWAFEWFNSGVKWIANGGEYIENHEHKKIQSDTTQMTFSVHALDKIYDDLQKNHPNAEEYTVRMPKGKLGTYWIYVDNGNSFNGVSMQYDQYSGKKLYSSTFSEANNGDKISWLNYDIHVGAILGLPGKILAFLVSLVITSMPVTGFMIWWGRNMKK